MRKYKLNEIKAKINCSLNCLYTNDKYILEHNGSERSITHCLAIYLKHCFPEYDVDCEYNINIEDDKLRKHINLNYDEVIKYKKNSVSNLKGIQEIDDTLVVSVFPDIIIHKRGSNKFNHIIVEVKKSTSTIDNTYDELKLKKYTADVDYGLKYKYGIFLKLSVEKNASPDKCVIEFFKAGEKIVEGK